MGIRLRQLGLLALGGILVYVSLKSVVAWIAGILAFVVSVAGLLLGLYLVWKIVGEIRGKPPSS